MNKPLIITGQGDYRREWPPHDKEEHGESLMLHLWKWGGAIIEAFVEFWEYPRDPEQPGSGSPEG